MHSEKQKAEKNIRKLKEVEVLISQGMNPPEASQCAGISIRTYYLYRKVYCRMRVDQAKRLINLEKENIMLRKLVTEKEHIIQEFKESSFVKSVSL